MPDEDARLVGWFVEIPRTLRDEFDRLYPGRRNKKILTITAIQHAIKTHPKSLYNTYKQPLEVTASDMADRERHEQGGSADAAGSEEAQPLNREHKPQLRATG